MNVLLIDNGTHYRQKLANLLADHNLISISHADVRPSRLKDIELIILSGAAGKLSVKFHADTDFKAEQAIVDQTDIPLIGICFGAQLIAHKYGARLSIVPGKIRVKGIKRIWNIGQTPFTSFPYYGAKVWASQRWRITELPDTLEAWCASIDGVEVFKHRAKEIYGLQFHPERRADKNNGHQIFHKIVELATGPTPRS